MTDYTNLSISQMLEIYNQRVQEILELGGTGNRRKSFRDRAEAEAYCQAIAERIEARKAEVEAEAEEPEVTETETKQKTQRALKGKDPADELTPMRAGTIRAEILELMDGTRTPEQIAEELDLEEHKVPAHLATMRKHTGIGYGYDAERRVKAVYPAGKTFRDAVKEPAEKKAKEPAQPAAA